MDPIDKMLCSINVPYLKCATRQDLIDMLSSGTVSYDRLHFAVSLFQDVPVSVWCEYLMEDRGERLNNALMLSHCCGASRFSRSIVYLESKRKGNDMTTTRQRAINTYENDKPWKKLLREALDILHLNHILEGHWTLGGGTVLAFSIQHRESHDVDIFFDDPQLLSYVSPKFSGDEAHYAEAANFIKLYRSYGEIDFILAPRLLHSLPLGTLHFDGISVPCEHPLEIVAKKLYYRGNDFTVRDWFDLAAVVERYKVDLLRPFILSQLHNLDAVPEPSEFLKLQLTSHYIDLQKLKGMVNNLSEIMHALQNERDKSVDQVMKQNINFIFDEPSL